MKTKMSGRRRDRRMVECLESRALLTAVSWTGGAGDHLWTTPGNWSINAVPGAQDDVTINVPGDTTILLANSAQAVRSLQTAESLVLTGASITLSGDLTLAGADVRLDGSTLQFNDGRTLGGQGQILFEANSGSINVQPVDSPTPQFTIGSGVTLRNDGGSGQLVGGADASIINLGMIVTDAGGQPGRSIEIYLPLKNEGTLHAGTGAALNARQVEGPLGQATIEAGGTLLVDGDYTVNQALAIPSGATLTLQGNWTNTSTLSLADGGTLNLGGTITQAAIGVIQRAGGTVNLTGVLSGGLSLKAATGSWNLAGGTIAGGTFQAADGASLTSTTGGTLDGVTLRSDFTVRSSTVLVVNGLTLSDVTVHIEGGSLQFMNDGSITGQGQVLFEREFGSVASFASSAPTGILTIAPGIAFRNNGGFGQLGLGYGGASIINRGLIESQASGQGGQGIIIFDPLTNEGTLRGGAGATFLARNVQGNLGVATLEAGASVVVGGDYTVNLPLVAPAGSTLSLTENWTLPAGVTISANSATLNLGDQTPNAPRAWTNLGTIDAVDSTLNLGGAISQASIGTIHRTGGTVNLTGVLSGGLSLDAATGSWNLAGGTISGGTFQATGGATLTASVGTLDGVTLLSDLFVRGGVSVVNDLTLSNVVVHIDGGVIQFIDGDQTLAGQGQVLFEDNGGSLYLQPSQAPTPKLTIAPAITIATDGGNGQVGGGYANVTTVNKGTILSQTAGHSIQIYGPLNNQGTLQVATNAQLYAFEATGGLGKTVVEPGAALTVGGTNYTLDQGLVVPIGSTASLLGSWTLPAGATLGANQATLSLGDQNASSPHAWMNLGLISVVDSTLNLGGAITQASLGTVHRTGGTVNLTGVLSGGLSLSAVTGSWNLVGGTLAGGTFQSTDGATLTAIGGGLLDGVTLLSDLTLKSVVGVVNNLTLSNVVVHVDGGAIQFIDGQQTLGGQGQVLFEPNGGAVYLQPSQTPSPSLTIGPNITIANDGGYGQLGGGYANVSIINRGVIAAQGGGRTIQFFDALSNQGAIRAGVGATVVLNAFVQDASGTLEFEVGGVPESGQFGRIIANNTVVLNGRATIIPTTHFEPAAGAEYPLFQFTGHVGDFAAVNGLQAGGVQLFNADLRPLSFTLVATGNPVPGPYPVVTDVFLSGARWTAGFLQGLATLGIGDLALGYHVGSGGEALANVAWDNLNRISIRFNQATNVKSSDLVIHGVRRPTYAIAGFAYDPLTNVATWTLADSIGADKLQLDLDGDPGGVTAVDGGRRLDGEYLAILPSGDGVEGGDFHYRLNVLPGDITHNGQVNAADVGQVRRRLAGHANPLGYEALADLDGSGAIDAADQSFVTAHLLDSLPLTRLEAFRPASARAALRLANLAVAGGD